MATTFGPEEIRISVGIDVTMSPSVVTKDTASVTLTWRVYARTTYAFNEGQILTVSNAVSDTVNYSIDTPNGQTTVHLIDTWVTTVATSYSGAVTKTLKGDISSVFNGATPSHTRSFVIPQRPPQLPSAPTAASSVRNSDSKATISWTRPANASTSGTQWQNAIVTRSVNGASWVTVATLPGTATSWADVSLSANASYRYNVYGRNTAGSSGVLSAGEVDTLPAAPTSVVAAKSGSNIVVTWVDNSPGNTSWRIEDNSVLVGTVANGTNTFTHLAPNPSVTHQYRVQAVTDTPVLYSLYAYSNTVQLQAAPNPPQNLAPNGGIMTPPSGDVLLTWSHNPVDTTDQTKYQVQHRISGSPTWTTLAETASSLQEHSLSGYGTGSVVEWQVKTWGDHPDGSPWSSTALFSLISRPEVGIVAPLADEVLAEPSFLVDWTYFQAESKAQSNFSVSVVDLGTGKQVAFVSSAGAATEWNTGDVLQNEGSYRITVQAVASGGVASLADSVDVTVEYAAPLDPLVELSWSREGGNVVAEITAPSDGVAPDPRSTRIERLNADGSWTIIGDGMDITGAVVIDWEVPLGVEVTYRVTAYSDLPSKASIESTIVTEPGFVAAYISGGPAFALVCPLVYSVTRKLNVGREKVLNRYDGRTSPTETSGVGIDRSISVDGKVLDDAYESMGWEAVYDDLEQLFEIPGPHLYRDKDGRVIYGSVGDIDLELGSVGSLGFALVETERGTDEQLAPIAELSGPIITEVRPGEYTVYGVHLTTSNPGEWGVE